MRKDLCLEAMRLTHLLTENEKTDQPKVNALLSLMCFHTSRFEARKNEKGELILYRDQDQTRWNQQLISKGADYLNRSARGKEISKYHLEANIATEIQPQRMVGAPETLTGRKDQLFLLLCPIFSFPIIIGVKHKFTKMKIKETEARINAYKIGHKGMMGLYTLGGYLANSSIEKSLLNLISFRVSQINGCAYCLDMHSKDLRAIGETEQRLYGLDAWRETPFYSEREHAALGWAEAVTACNVSDEIYEDARKHFSERELIDLTLGVVGVNSFNRINIAFKTTAGTYQPGQHEVLTKGT